MLITGGLGFIGHHLSKRLYDLGYDITIIDDLSNNCIEPENELLSNYKVIVDDIINIDEYDLSYINIVIHLASPIGTVSLLNSPGKIADRIINDTYLIIDFCLRNNSKLVFFSTCEVYGNPESNVPLKENYNKIVSGKYSVRNEYAISKMLSEVIIENTSKYSGLKYHIIRPFNVIGPMQRYESGHVIPRFFMQANSLNDITVYGDGSQERCFTWVYDTVEAVYLCINSADNLWNNIWNIGNTNNKISIKDLARMIVNITGSSSKIINVDPKSLHGDLFEDSPIKIPDYEKATRNLGWIPQKTINDILKEINESK